MKNKEIVFSFVDKPDLYSFPNKVSFVEDINLIKNLGQINIKNEESSLIIKSMNNLPIYDVIQLKINVSDTGVILVNFDKEKFDEKTRQKLIESIKVLKSDEEPTVETQQKKILTVIKILNEYKPIYVTFKNTGDIKINLEELKEVNTKFPFLVLKKPVNFKAPGYSKVNIKKATKEKHKHIHIKVQDNDKVKKAKPVKEEKPKIEKVKKQKPEKVKKIKPSKVKKIKAKKVKKVKSPKIKKEKPIKQPKVKKPKIRENYPRFAIDYIFIMLFAILLSFGIVTAVLKIGDDLTATIFLFVLSLVLVVTLVYGVYSTLFKRAKLRYRSLASLLLIYILVGSLIGLGVGYVVCRFSLKLIYEPNIEFFIACDASLVLSLVSVPISYFVGYIARKNKEKNKIKK